jgi:streptomycin 6-kinase
VDLTIPPRFRAFAGRGEDWAAWLDELPRLTRDLLDEWDLRTDGDAVHGEATLVVPVRTADGTAAVLKISWPHWEASYEHLALRDWNGAGAVRLFRADPKRYALLLERVHPRDLSTVDVIEACELVAAAYPRLHIPAGPQYRRLSAETTHWADGLAALPSDAPVPRRYVEQAVSLARDLIADCDGKLIHTDLHYYNVLAADREPWLVIDPKPLSGDPHYEVAPLLWNRWEEVVGTGDIRTEVRRRFHAVVDAAGLDEDRASDWVIVRELVNILWALEDEASDETQDWITTALTIAKAVQD